MTTALCEATAHESCALSNPTSSHLIMLKPVLALPASQFCVRRRVVRSSKRQRTELLAGPQVPFEWDEYEQLLHDEYIISPTTDACGPYQIPWLVPPVSAGLETDPLMNSKSDESPSGMMTTVLWSQEVPPQQQHATNCTSSGAENGARTYSKNYCRSIVPRSSALPISGFLDAAPPVLTKTKSLLAAVSMYLNSSKAVKRRHSRDEISKCCLCHNSEDDSDRTAVHTLEELKAVVHNDLAEMLRPIRKDISTLKTDVGNKCEKHLPPGVQPVPLQMVSGNVRVPNGGTFLSPGSSRSVLASDSYFRCAKKQHTQRYHPSTEYAQADHLQRNLPMLVEEFPVNPTEAQTGAEPDWYSEKLKEKNLEIEALQATVYDLVGYQQKITVEFDKVKRHLCNQAAQKRPLSSSSFPDGRPTLYLNLLESTCQAATAALDRFTTHFIVYSESRFHVPANKIWKPNFRSVYLAKESHWTYALKAFFSEKMFVGFENESFMTDAASLYLDPDKLKKDSYAYFKRASSMESSSSTLPSVDPHFRTYCEQKFDSIVPDAILLQPGDYDENDVRETSFPTLAEVNLSTSFTAAAMKVWILHKLCYSFEPAAKIFRARRGLNIDWNYMESVVRLEDDERFIPKVGFMVAPGFRLRNSTVKSQIYLAAKPRASQVGIHGRPPA